MVLMEVVVAEVGAEVRGGVGRLEGLPAVVAYVCAPFHCTFLNFGCGWGLFRKLLSAVVKLAGFLGEIPRKGLSGPTVVQR